MLTDNFIAMVGCIEDLACYKKTFQGKPTDGTVEDADRIIEELETRAEAAEKQAIESEKRAKLAEQRTAELEAQLKDVNHRVEVLEKTTQSMEKEERREAVDQPVASKSIPSQHEESWAIEREEIKFTNRELGKGSWAVVRAAMFRGLPVAAKCLRGMIISSYNRQMFVSEMNTAARVRHPNILQFIGATTEGEPIILLELMTTSLGDVLKQGPLSFPQIVSISTSVARALNYLHLMKPEAIIHNDISSANVLLDPIPDDGWRAKISADFAQRVTNSALVSSAYTAPEATDPTQQSAKTDVYSYGILLIEMCSQQLPTSETREGLSQSIQWPAMMSLTNWCLNDEPTYRPTMTEMLELLGGI